MRILILSDTHGELSKFRSLYNKLKKEFPVDRIVHCGDYARDASAIRSATGLPVLSVPGNCDGDYQEGGPVLETEAGNFFVCHGHMYNVQKDLQNLYYKTLESGCVGALFGHTHRGIFLEMDGIYLMNPGSLTKPRDGSGGTFGILETDCNSVRGTIYRYEDFMAHKPTQSSRKVKGGMLRRLLNYSDRF